jgi:hypothetical protein
MLARILILILGIGIVVSITGKPLDVGPYLDHLDWWKVVGGTGGGTVIMVLITRPVRTLRARKAARTLARQEEFRQELVKELRQEFNEEIRGLRKELKRARMQPPKKRKKSE